MQDHTLHDFLMGNERLPWIANNNGVSLLVLAVALPVVAATTRETRRQLPRHRNKAP